MVRAYEQRSGAQLGQRHECRGKVALAACVHDVNLLTNGARGFLDILQLPLGRETGGVQEHTDQRGRRNQLVQESQPFAFHLADEHVHTGDVAIQSIEAGDQPILDRVSAGGKTIGISVVAALAAKMEFNPPVETITATCRRTRSAASAGSCSYRPSAQRHSMPTLRCST